MADFNPLSSLPDPKDFMGSNMGGTFMLPGFFSAQQGRQEAAAPFIQMAQEAERQKIQQASQMNPLLVQKQGLENTGLQNTNNRFSQSTPHVVRGLELGNIKAGMENDSMAMDNAVKGVETPEKIRGIQERPLNQAIDMFSSSAEQIKKLPPPLQVGAYMKLANGVAASITDPAMRQRFTQEFMSDPTAGFQRLQAQAAQKYNTPAAAQARDTANITGEYHLKGAQVHAGATIEAARIREASAEKLQQMQLDNPKNAAVMVLRAKAFLANPPANTTPDKIAEMEGIVEGDMQSQALKEYTAYANSMTGIQDARSGKGKTMNDFLTDVKSRYKNTGAPRPGPTPQNAIQQKVLESGVQYEPDKYEYRITPDGSVQRKAK